jgi:asparagine synthase (glutamine-hydrolysing)
VGALYGEVSSDWAQPIEAAALARCAQSLKHRARAGLRTRSAPGVALMWANAGTPNDALLDGQPWVDRDLWLVFDGQLANHIALCAELKLPAHTRLCALLVAAWRRWGAQMMPRLDGDFALVLLDFSLRKLLLVRDPLGARALHYRLFPACANRAARLCFASEEQALVALTETPCDHSVAHYFAFAQHSATQSMFSNVQTLAAGSALSFANAKVSVTLSEFAIPEPTSKLSLADASARYRQLLTEALTRCARLDLKLGISLSGGLDSNALLATALELSHKVEPISWRFARGHVCDESEFALLHTQSRGLDLTLFSAEPLHLFAGANSRPVSLNTPRANPYRELKTALYAHSANAGTYTLCNGAFADHLFFDPTEWLLDALKLRDFSVLSKELYWRLKQTPQFWREPSLRRTLRRLLLLPVHRAWAPQLLTPFAQKQLEANSYNGDFRHHQKQLILGGHAQFGASGEAEFAERFGIDVQTPYRNAALIRFMLSLPVHLSQRQGISKLLVREAFKDRMPEAIRLRPKATSLQPFLDHALANAAKQTASALLFSKSADWPRFYQRERLENLFAKSNRSDQETAFVWTCLAYEQWRAARGLRC